MDAPFHCAPRTGGRDSRTIDTVPLEWCWGRGACVHLREERSERRVGLDEIAAFERRHGEIAEGTIVLFRTGAERWHRTPEYVRSGRPLSPRVVESLAERGVRVIGTDAWSIDPSLEAMRDTVSRRGPGSAWEAHKAVERRELCIIERLRGLAELPPTGFWVSCFPIKLSRGSAGWVRPVALVPREGRDVQVV